MRYLLIFMLVCLPIAAHSAITISNANGGLETTVTTLSAAATGASYAGKTITVTSALSAIQSNISSATMHKWPTDRTLKVVTGGSVNPTTKFVMTGVDEIPIKWFGGAKGDGVTDDKAAINVALKVASDSRIPIRVSPGKYRIRGTLTTPDNGFIHLRGNYTGLMIANNITDFTKYSTFYFDPTSGTSLIDQGDHNFFSYEGMVFTTSDPTQAWIGLSIASLGNFTTQTAADGIFKMRGNYFSNFGASAIAMGGECYGDISYNSFYNNSQDIVINGQGEVDIIGNQFNEMNPVAFTPGANNHDAKLAIEHTVVNITGHNNFQTNVMPRPYIYVYDSPLTNINGNKFETPGLTTLAHNYITLHSVTGGFGSITTNIENNAMLASSLDSGAHAGRFVATLGDYPIRQLNFNKNSCTYSPATSSAVPILDVSTNKPVMIHASGNYREGGDNPLILVAAGATGADGVALAGIKSDQAQYYTVRSPEFTIGTAQTGTTIPIGGAKLFASYSGKLAQYIPVSMDVQSDGDSGDTVSFYIGQDVSKTDKITFTAGAQRLGYKYFPLRSVYTPNLSTAAGGLSVVYDSGASAATGTKYVVTITYAVVEDPSSTGGVPGMIQAL